MTTWSASTSGRLGALVLVGFAIAMELALGRGVLRTVPLLAVLVAAAIARVLLPEAVGGEALTVVLVGAFVAHAVFVSWRPTRRWPERTTDIAVFAAPISVLAAWAWFRSESLPRTVALFAAALVLVEVQHRVPGGGRRAAEAVQVGLERFGSLLVSVVVLIAAIPMIIIPGGVVRLFERLMRADRRVAGGWQPTGSEPNRRRDAARPFAAPPPGVARRRHLAGLVTLAVVSVAAVAVNHLILDVRRNEAEQSPTAAQTPAEPSARSERSLADRMDDVPYHERAAMRGLPYADQLQRETLAVPLVEDERTGYRLGPVDSQLISTSDGVRRTAPSSCRGCPTTRLFLAGGSLVFGVGQRDEHTIASELVALAAEDGVNLDVVNLGVPGWTVDQEAIDLRDRLAVNPRAADLVVFLDGFNDATATLVDSLEDPAALDGPARLDQERGERLLASKATVDREEAAEIGTAAGERFLRTSGPLDDELAALGIDVFRFFQPDASSDPVQRRSVEDLGALPDGFYDRYRFDEVLGATARHLGPSAIDLRSVYREVDEPVFIDTSHVNEDGARMLAEEMYPYLRDAVRERAR